MAEEDEPPGRAQRRSRLSAQLLANLQRRTEQARARRSGLSTAETVLRVKKVSDPSDREPDREG